MAHVRQSRPDSGLVKELKKTLLLERERDLLEQALKDDERRVRLQVGEAPEDQAQDHGLDVVPARSGQERCLLLVVRQTCLVPATRSAGLESTGNTSTASQLGDSGGALPVPASSR
jgi:hypothetical protein